MTTRTDTDADTDTLPAIVLIDGEEYDSEVCFGASRVSNSAYHRMGKARWWCLVRPGVFADIPSVRCDHDLELPATLAAEIVAEHGAVTITLGCGPRGHKDARRVSWELAPVE
jgi:hypothetical protein